MPVKPPSRFQQENVDVGGSLTKKASFNVEAGHNANDDSNFVNAVVLDSNFQPVRSSRTSSPAPGPTTL